VGIYHSYVELYERHIEPQVSDKFIFFHEIDYFYFDFAEQFEKYEAINHEAADTLQTFTKFGNFRSKMVKYQSSRNFVPYGGRQQISKTIVTTPTVNI